MIITYEVYHYLYNPKKSIELCGEFDSVEQLKKRYTEHSEEYSRGWRLRKISWTSPNRNC